MTPDTPQISNLGGDRSGITPAFSVRPCMTLDFVPGAIRVEDRAQNKSTVAICPQSGAPYIANLRTAQSGVNRPVVPWPTTACMGSDGVPASYRGIPADAPGDHFCWLRLLPTDSLRLANFLCRLHSVLATLCPNSNRFDSPVMFIYTSSSITNFVLQ